MKNVIFGLAIAATIITACNSNKSSANQNGTNGSQADLQSKNATTSTAFDAVDVVAIKEIVNQYLQIKNGLANDNGNDAASAGKAFVKSIDKMDKTSLTAEKKEIWNDISADC